MQATIELAEAKESALSSQGSAIIAESKKFADIRDDSHRDEAMASGQRIKQMRQLVADLFDDPIAQAHKLHKTLCSRRKVLDDPLLEAETAVRRSIGAYEQRKRQELEAKRQAEIAEARRRQEEADRERQRQIEEARRAEEDRRLEQAAALESAGRCDLATQALDAPIAVQPPPPPPVVTQPRIETPAYVAPKDAGLRTTWKFRIIDQNLIPREYMVPDVVKIGAVVRTTKGTVPIAGIEAYADQTANLR